MSEYCLEVVYVDLHLLFYLKFIFLMTNNIIATKNREKKRKRSEAKSSYCHESMMQYDFPNYAEIFYL